MGSREIDRWLELTCLVSKNLPAICQIASLWRRQTAYSWPDGCNRSGKSRDRTWFSATQAPLSPSLPFILAFELFCSSWALSNQLLPIRPDYFSSFQKSAIFLNSAKNHQHARSVQPKRWLRSVCLLSKHKQTVFSFFMFCFDFSLTWSPQIIWIAFGE